MPIPATDGAAAPLGQVDSVLFQVARDCRRRDAQYLCQFALQASIFPQAVLLQDVDQKLVAGPLKIFWRDAFNDRSKWRTKVFRAQFRQILSPLLRVLLIDGNASPMLPCCGLGWLAATLRHCQLQDVRSSPTFPGQSCFIRTPRKPAFHR